MCKEYGYCRISTAKQKIERQESNIKAEYPAAVIFREEYTGTTTDRPVWNRLYRQLKEGDTVIFDEVSRMSRNAAEGVELYKDLYGKGVNLVFLKEHHIDTETYKNALNNGVQMTGTDIDCILEGVNRYMMRLAEKQIEIAFNTAQAEVDHLHKRTSEGVRKAQERYDREEILGIEHEKGKVGRAAGATVHTAKYKKAKQIIKEHSISFGGTLKDPEVMKLAGVSRNSYYKYKREIAAEAVRKP